MEREAVSHNKKVEKIFLEILETKARAKIYMFLLRNNGAMAKQITDETGLHPSTVRETLLKMCNQNLINRKKIKNNKTGKKPYGYYPISIVELVERYLGEVKEKLNYLSDLDFSKEKHGKNNGTGTQLEGIATQ